MGFFKKKDTQLTMKMEIAYPELISKIVQSGS